MDLTLSGDTCLVRMIKLDRILNRNDMCMVLSLVNDVDHRGQSCGFTGTGRPSHQDHAARRGEQLVHQIGIQPDNVQSQQFVRNLPQYQSHVTPLFECGDPETSLLSESKTKVGPPLGADILNLVVIGNGFHQIFHILRFTIRAFHTFQCAALAVGRRNAHTHMKVSRPGVNHQVEQVWHPKYGFFFWHNLMLNVRHSQSLAPPLKPRSCR